MDFYIARIPYPQEIKNQTWLKHSARLICFAMRISILLCVQRKKNILMTEMIVIYVLPVEVAVFE